MKRETHIVLCLIGFVGLGVLLYQLSTPEVWQHVLMMGWGYVPVIGLSLVVFVHHAWIWRACFDRGEKRPRLRQLLWVQLAGEAVGNVAPASQVGKEVGKAIVLRDKMCVSRGVSSLVVNKTGEMIGGVIFVIGGVVIGLQRFSWPAEVRGALIAVLALSVLGVVWTVFRQRRSPFARFLNLMLWLRLTFLERFRDRAVEIDENLAQFYRLNRWRLVGLLGLHLLGWSMGTLEIYVILYVLGEPMPFVWVYLFHALMVVINAAFFFVPLGMGVFEGGHVFLFHLMGLDPKMGLAVGIIRRVRRLFWMQVGLTLLLIGSRDKQADAAPKNDGLQQVEM